MKILPIPMRRPAFHLLMASLFFPLPFSPARAEEPPAITVQEALDTALRQRAELAGFAEEVRSAEGRILQASLRPNPEAEVEIANFGGDLPGAGRSETTVGVSQRLEVGGKRPARTRAAEAEIPVLRRDVEALRLDVIAEVRRAHVGLLGAQRRLDLAREGHDIAARLAGTAAAQVAAGSVSPIEETRAKAALAVAAAEVLRSGREVEETRQELGRAMGIPRPSFGAAAGELSEDLSVPGLETLLARLPANPDLARWEPEKARRAAALDAERTLAMPDVTVSGAYRRLEEDSENTFVLGFSVPLPLFNRNQGAVREASARLAKAEQERRGIEIGIRAQLAQRHAAMAAAAREAAVLKEGALANAQAAYDAVNEGYRLGKFRYLDVLDAGRALIDSRLRYTESLVALGLAGIDLERLTAK